MNYLLADGGQAVDALARRRFEAYHGLVGAAEVGVAEAHGGAPGERAGVVARAAGRGGAPGRGECTPAAAAAGTTRGQQQRHVGRALLHAAAAAPSPPPEPALGAGRQVLTCHHRPLVRGRRLE